MVLRAATRCGPASVLLAEEDGEVVGDGRDELPADVDRRRGGRGRDAGARSRPTRPTAGRGIFASSRRRTRSARASSGSRLLLIVPERGVGADPASAGSAGRTLPRAPRLGAAAAAAARAARAPRSASSASTRRGRRRARRGGDRVLRDAAWLNWRFADSPRAVRAARSGGGYAVVGAARRGSACVAAVEGDLLARRGRGRGRRRALVAAPPPWEHAALRSRRATCRRRGRSRVLGKSLDPARRCPRGRTSSSATSTSCDATARLRHAAGRPGRTRCSAPTVPKIRALAARVDEVVVLADARGRRARCRRTAASALFGAGSQRRPRAALRGRARARARRRGRSRSSRTWSRSTPSSPRRSRGRARVPLLLWFTHWKPSPHARARRARSRPRCSRVDRRSFPLDSRQGRRDRPRDRHSTRFRCVEREPGERAARRRARAHLAGEGLRDDRARGRARRTSTSSCAGPSSPTRSAPSAQRLAALGARVEEPVPYAEVAGAARAQGRAREQHARGRARQGRLRGGGDVHAGARVEHRLRRRAAAGAPLRARRRRRPRRRSSARSPDVDRNALGRELRARVEARHSVEHWADEVLEVARR